MYIMFVSVHFKEAPKKIPWLEISNYVDWVKMEASNNNSLLPHTTARYGQRNLYERSWSVARV